MTTASCHIRVDAQYIETTRAASNTKKSQIRGTSGITGPRAVPQGVPLWFFFPSARGDSRPGPHQREGDDVADRGHVGEEHHQAVDPQPHAAGGRHAATDRLQEVLVDGMVSHSL